MESEDDQLYIPQVKFKVVPKLKQEFETLDVVTSFYNRYAKEGGFSTISHTSKLGKDNTIVTRKEYVCSKQGDSKIEGEKRKRGLPKMGCKARIAVVRKKTGKYAVFLFVDSHNHPLTSPSIVQFLRSHRGVSKVSKVLSNQLSLVNVKRHKQFEFFGVQAGGIENVGFIQRDLYNYGSSIREHKNGHDGDLLYMHFENEKEKDPSFVYKMESDEEKKFRRGPLHQCNHELREDHTNIEEKVKTAMSLDIEDDMAKVYTRKCFYEVQEQLKESFKYKLELLRENETESMFKVIRKNIDTSKSCEVIYKKGSDFASCSCRKWTKVAR
ncbi:hypothetical protein ACLB2K_016293 [Fragaria x ananassa]